MVNEDEKIRVIALAVLRQHDRIFVTEYIHAPTGNPYYRPLGGGIEFYETGEDAIQRELREEIGADLMNVHYLGMLENLFTTDDGRGHQICLLYSAQFVENDRNAANYVVEGHEKHESFQAMWKSISLFQSGIIPLYPNGLLDLLEKYG